MRIIGIDKNTLARWVREGYIPAFRTGQVPTNLILCDLRLGCGSGMIGS